jgi:rare lipoprotein A
MAKTFSACFPKYRRLLEPLADGIIPLVLILAVLSAYLNGCAARKSPPQKPVRYPKPYQVFGQWYQPLSDAKGFRQRGIASWYGKDFHGKKTSNGEIYNMYAMTAAHKTLPLGTYVRVQHLASHRSVEVRINDRGPFVRDRIIDLSYTAAKDLGIVGPGTAEVEIFALGTPADSDDGGTRSFAPGDYYTGNFTFQVGAFLNRENAERLMRKLDKQYRNAHLTIFDNGKDIFYRVRVGHADSLEKAAEFEARLIQNGFPGVFTVAE